MLIIIVALLISGAAIAGILIYRIPERAARPPKPPQFHWFYGRVVDQTGNPIPNAEIDVLAAEFGDNAVIHGSIAPILETQKTFTVASNQNGYFTVTLPGSYQRLTIQNIRKPGYEWVIDWYWTTPETGDADNRYYHLRGPRNVGAIYEPDRNRPAIFPMHEIGNPVPATRPSRGGKDGRRVNGPTDLVVPSAGPGAPRTNAQINEAIRAASERQREDAAATGEQRRSGGYGPPGD